jgi:NADH-quinone oxidoreductase subunit M
VSLPLLSLTTFVPLLGALAILAMPRPDSARWIALGTTIVTFVLSLMVWAAFDLANPGFQLVEKHDWLGGGISYHMGVDGISMLFVVLTAGLMPFCIAARWKAIEHRVAEYMVAFLVLETMMIGVFAPLISSCSMCCLKAA